MQKNATPTREQQQILKAKGLNPLEWVAVKDYDHSMIIKHRYTGEFRTIEK